MTKLISTSSQAISNIKKFNANAESYADVMPYAKGWYAIRHGKGWLLGPSKLIGYADMTPAIYEDKRRLGLDGRVTEKVLAKWANPITANHPDFLELSYALAALCAAHGKTPNALARFSIVEDKSAISSNPSDDLVALLAAVYRTLPAEQQTEFRRQIR